jgi:hypothetical protein
MTAENLYGTLKFLDALDTQLRLQASLDLIKDTLDNLVNAPANPAHQGALASALATFATSAATLHESISPSQAAIITDLGGGDFFDPSIADKVQASISANAMTPSVARDFVQKLSTQRAAFLATVRSTLQGLKNLRIKEGGVPAGSADLAFLIPRDLFENHLGSFAKELEFISRLIQHFSEALTGQPETVKLEQLSSSEPTITLGVSLIVIKVLGETVNKFLEAWERVQKIRKLRAELSEVGMKGEAIDQLTERITTTVDEVIEESCKVVLLNYKADAGRKHELANAVRQDTRRLFGQIERGLTIHFRADPNGDGDGVKQEVLENIAKLSREIQYPQISNEPILLENGEIIEASIQVTKNSKRTTTHKTTSTKSETQKEMKPNAEE